VAPDAFGSPLSTSKRSSRGGTEAFVIPYRSPSPTPAPGEESRDEKLQVLIGGTHEMVVGRIMGPVGAGEDGEPFPVFAVSPIRTMGPALLDEKPRSS
jgi:hypothetical protein